MYAGTTSTQQQQQQPSPQQQQQQQQPNLPLQGLSASAGQLMREIMTKFPRLNPQIHNTIYDFLNTNFNHASYYCITCAFIYSLKRLLINILYYNQMDSSET